jgi:hypothetical protein
VEKTGASNTAEEVIEFKDYLRSGPVFDDLEMDRASDAGPFGRPAVSPPRG